MPKRTTDPPPPTKKAPPLMTRRLFRSDAPAGESEDEADITVGEADIALDEVEAAEQSAEETEISLDELELDDGDDPCPSPFERITIAPGLSEREYVAHMMRQAPASDPVPPSRPTLSSESPTLTGKGALALAPEPEETPDADEERASGTVSKSLAAEPSPHDMSLDSLSSWPVPADPFGPLTLELGDSVPPPAVEEAPPISVPPAPRPANGASPSFRPVSGDALELVGVRAQSVRPQTPPTVSMREVRDRFDVGDFSGALILAEAILEHDPESVDALLYAEHCRDVLKQMYISRLGGVKRVPQVAVTDEQLRWLSLDHRAGFLLSLVDGRSSFEEVLDMSGMPPVDALRLLMELLQQNVIKVGEAKA
jgi:hypothetical protein